MFSFIFMVGDRMVIKKNTCGNCSHLLYNHTFYSEEHRCIGSDKNFCDNFEMHISNSDPQKEMDNLVDDFIESLGSL